MAPALLIVVAGCGDPPAIREYTAPSGAADRPFTCSVPSNWHMVPNDRFSNLAFENDKGPNGTARITVSALEGTGEEFLAVNLNRWRRQMLMGPAESMDGMETVQLTHAVARVVDLSGAGKALRGAMVEYEDKTWFFKLSGSPEAVKDQTDEFDTFLKSIEFIEPSGAE